MTAEQSLTQFIKAFGASLDVRLWLKLVKEETEELRAAHANESREAVLKECADVAYVACGCVLVGEPLDDLINDELKAELEAAAGEAHRVFTEVTNEQGFTAQVLGEAFDRVHASNMSKLGDDGKPIKREDGKVLKGPNYKAPDLSDLV